MKPVSVKLVRMDGVVSPELIADDEGQAASFFSQDVLGR